MKQKKRKKLKTLEESTYTLGKRESWLLRGMKKMIVVHDYFFGWRPCRAQQLEQELIGKSPVSRVILQKILDRYYYSNKEVEISVAITISVESIQLEPI